MHKFIKAEKLLADLALEVGGGEVWGSGATNPCVPIGRQSLQSYWSIPLSSWLLEQLGFIKCFHCWLIVPMIIWLIMFWMAIVLFVASSTKTKSGGFRRSWDLDCGLSILASLFVFLSWKAVYKWTLLSKRIFSHIRCWPPFKSPMLKQQHK